MKEKDRERIPGFLKNIYRHVVILSRYPFARYRALPNFLIIGVQKGGTTTLSELLRQHPNIKTSVFKEVHYYDFQYQRGRKWYRSFFPFLSKNDNVLYGETSPYYFFHPLVPARVYKDNPATKLILLLRDPVERAYSHYQMERRKGREKLKTFEEAISKETDRIQNGHELISAGKTKYHQNHHTHSYLARGCYDEQMKQWLDYFKRDQILVLRSENFFADPLNDLKKVYEFLGIPEIFPKHVSVKNQGTYNPVQADTIRQLRNYYQPHNEALSKILGEGFQWQ